tara:strand:+ start:205 stop:468 length:264 start_codon:yes stop_codon:yes gene_type:complete
MPSEDQIKKLLLESLRQTVTRKALRFISKTKEPEEKEYDLIAVRHVAYLFTAKEYEKLADDWKWGTSKNIPVTLQEALDYIDDFNPV